jgi:hypothetical protein
MSPRLDPVIVFAFSKKECEALAMQLSKLDLCEEAERNQVEKVSFPSSLSFSLLVCPEYAARVSRSLSLALAALSQCCGWPFRGRKGASSDRSLGIHVLVSLPPLSFVSFPHTAHGSFHYFDAALQFIMLAYCPFFEKSQSCCFKKALSRYVAHSFKAHQISLCFLTGSVRHGDVLYGLEHACPHGAYFLSVYTTGEHNNNL